MSRSTPSLWGQMSRAVELHLAGHDDAAFDALFAGLDCPYDVCAMACGLANAIAVHVPRPEGTQLITTVVGDTPDTDQEDVVTPSEDGAADATPMVRSRATAAARVATSRSPQSGTTTSLWHLLLFLSTTLRDRQS